ncbi:MAG: hypothetical protein ABH836_02570 [Candidatus Omnitrophota bacterium]
MHRNNFEPKCLATGIGSLPYKDSQTAFAKAKETFSKIPFWPQLPKRSYLEGMNTQFVEKFACLRADDKEKTAVFEGGENKEEQLAIFYEKILNLDSGYFEISKEYAETLYLLLEELKENKLSEAEFVKGQVTGPFTMAASIKGENGKTVLFDAMMFDMIINGLAMKALWQAEQFKKFKKKPIIFFDEPYLSCLGSAYAPISNQEVSQRLLELFNPLKQSGVLVGIHCCGNTDWPVLLNSMTDIVSFDAWGYFDKIALYSGELKSFLEAGGVLAFGIVPTQDIPKDLSAQMIVEKIEKQFDVLAQKGIDKKLILKKCLLTGSCGLGTAEIKDAEKVLEVLKGASAILREKYFK